MATATEKKWARDSAEALQTAWNALNAEWSTVVQTLTDEKEALQEKFDNLSERGRSEGERGEALQAKIEALEFVDEMSSDEHGDYESVQTLMDYLENLSDS